MLTVPFIAFLLAEKIEPFPDMKGSGVVAVVIAAFYLTYLRPGHHQTAEPHLRAAHLGVRHLRHERRAIRAWSACSCPAPRRLWMSS